MSSLEKPADANAEAAAPVPRPTAVAGGAPTTTAGSSASPAAGQPQKNTNTHFLFQHKVFNVPGAYFSVAHDSRQPVLHFLLGDLKASVPFPTLREAFEIPDESADFKLLQVVEKGLSFVKVIRPGESIPSELLDGSASWKVEEKHRMIAKGRLTVQIVSWVTGNEAIVVDLTQLEQLVEDPLTKQRLQMAFGEIAKRLGIPDERKQEIIDRVDAFAHELSYIEALRDRYSCIRSINDKLVLLTKVYRTDRNLTQELSRMLGLFGKATKEFDPIFEMADAQTSEILGALKAFEAQVSFIRQVRDDLHIRLMDWDEVIAGWQDQPAERCQKVENLLKALYRFLANKYIEVKVWARK